MRRGDSRAGVMVLAVLLIGGCAGGRAGEMPRPATATELTPIQAQRLFPLEAREELFRVSTGSGKPRLVRATLRPQGDRWAHEFEGVRRLLLQQNEAGDVLVLVVEEFGEGVSVTYEPGVLMLPGEVTGESRLQGEVSVVVRNLSDGKVRDQGTCEWALLGVEQGETVATAGAGESTYRVRSVRKMDLTLADVIVHVDTHYVPDVGEVAQRVTRRTRALGLFSDTKVELMERASTGEH